MSNTKPFMVQATYASNVSASINENGMRITFGETEVTDDAPPTNIFHLAVFMPMEVAKKFQQMVNSLIEQHEGGKPN